MWCEYYFNFYFKFYVYYNEIKLNVRLVVFIINNNNGKCFV